MSSNPNVIDISSESTESSKSNGWTNYFPPTNTCTSSVSKKAKGKVESSSINQKAKGKVEASSDSSFFEDSWVSSYHSKSEEDHVVSKNATTDQGESKLVIAGGEQQHTSTYASYHVNNTPRADVPYNGRVVLGLPNQHTWEVIEAQKWKRFK